MIHKKIDKPVLLTDSTPNNIAYEIYVNNAYVLDFKPTKKTIILENKSTVFVSVPRHSILLITGNFNYLTYVFMGKRNKNIIEGINLNGYNPYICGLSLYYLQINNPEEDIKKCIDLYWLSTFPYYNKTLMETQGINKDLISVDIRNILQ